jgi:putative transposase
MEKLILNHKYMNRYSEPKLEYNSVYHIYNCGIDGCDLYVDDEDYHRFLSKFATYIEPIADTYAWSLLGNHFHVVVRIKKESEIKTLEELDMYEVRTEQRTPEKKPDPTKQLSHLFNSYAHILITNTNVTVLCLNAHSKEN